MKESLTLAGLYWAEYAYRAEVYWRLFFRASIGITALLGFPFLQKNLVGSDDLGRLVLLFPIAALALALASGWALLASAQRAYVVGNIYMKILNQQTPKNIMASRDLPSLFKFGIANVSAGAFVLFFALFSVVEFYLLWSR